ncbi:HWE histidine kinase domain-containing protein [Parvularcula maris]|uniref:histidine kinase n=1 Tax=Parvularcula maris TaxID=2965077 RepID=A0A9X2LA02_9PROT|nr:HWE histidine kinase domain-containing protein [Parvularcula maris]MCQ8185858.1 GAF domain-containing protein [Parvularcula maris]
MTEARPHPQEAARLAALQSYGILDTEADPAFDTITALAARICGTSIALVSLVDRERQWFKSRKGLGEPETGRDVALCAHAILLDEPLVIPDTLADPRFRDNPLCTEGPVRFYTGIPLVGSENLPLGTLCVIDPEPRPEGLGEEQLEELKLLAHQTVRLMELQRQAARQATALQESVHRTKNVLAVASAIATRTLSGERSLEEAKSVLIGRFQSLGHAQGHLLAASDRGASLHDLIASQMLAFFPEEDDRLSIEGPAVTISGEAAEAIGLALHELSTNATKYGALSVRTGTVTIGWHKNAEGLLLTWREEGGPSPSPSPGRRGFGSSVVGPMCGQKIGGPAVLTLPPTGAVWTAQIAEHHLRSPILG